MQTSNEDIYAAGDVIGGILSTPVSRMEGMAAIKNIMGKNIKPDYSLIPMTVTLPYDVSYLLGTEVSNEGKTIKLPGAAGPGTFWHTVEGKNGFTKENINLETNEINNILAITPSSNIALPYMIKAIKDGKKADNFDNFLEIHPSTDGISKLTEYYKRYS
jgi:dihydrolipoamide dehydrogenase